jgi:hypothetical protein
MSQNILELSYIHHLYPRNPFGVTAVEQTTFACGTGDIRCEEFGFSASTLGRNL